MRRWRDYQTATERRPVKQFIERLDDTDAAAVVAAMDEVEVKGLAAAPHLDGDIYEVRADGNRAIYRVLFAPQAGQAAVARLGAPWARPTEVKLPSCL